MRQAASKRTTDRQRSGSVRLIGVRAGSSLLRDLQRHPMPSRVQVVHRLHRDEHREVELRAVLRVLQAQVAARRSARSCPRSRDRSCTDTTPVHSATSRRTSRRIAVDEARRLAVASRARARRRTAAADRDRRSSGTRGRSARASSRSACRSVVRSRSSGSTRRRVATTGGCPAISLHQLVHVLELAQRRPVRVARRASRCRASSQTANVSAKSSSGWLCAYQESRCRTKLFEYGLGR